MTVKELLNKLDSNELNEWMAYYRIEPFGNEIEDMRNALIALLIAQTNSDGKKRFKIEDFMIKTKENKNQSAEELFKSMIEFAKQKDN